MCVCELYLYTLLCIYAAPSGPPQSVSASALDPRIIQINWSQPLPEEQNGIIQSYLVNITVAKTGQRIQHTTNSNTHQGGIP